MSVPLPESLAAVLARQARLRPEAVALRFEGAEISYGELGRNCEQLAAQLWHRWGLREGDRLAWLGGNHPGQLMLLFALARIGAMWLPLNHRLTATELESLVADCGACHLVYDAHGADLALDLGSRGGLTLHAVGELLSEPAAPAAPDLGRPSSPVLLVYTSG